jgi:hypothetical protein
MKYNSLSLAICGVIAVFIITTGAVIISYIDTRAEFTCEELKGGVWFSSFGDCSK